MMDEKKLLKLIRTVPDFPAKGVQFKDISSILENPEAFQFTVTKIAGYVAKNNITHIVAPDARGFLWGAPIAIKFGLPLHIVRKKGKLPPPTRQFTYKLEYAEETLELNENTVFPEGSRICIIDDVSATGGTASAMVSLCRAANAEDIHYACVIDLTFLEGTAKLLDYCGVEAFSVLEIE